MKKTAILGVLLAALVLLLSGCEGLNFFEFNLFEELQYIDPAGTATDITTDPDTTNTEKMDQIEDLMDSDQFLESLQNDPTALATIVEYLEGLVDGPADQPEEQQALLLTAKIDIQTTGGDELVGGVVTMFTDMLSQEEGDPEPSMGTIIGAILPDGTGVTDFTSMVTGLYNANDAYDELGTALTGDTTLNVEGLNEGEMAQNILVANILSNCINDIAGVADPDETEVAEAAAELFVFLEAVKTAENPDEVTSPFSTDEFDPFEDLTTEGSGIYNLLGETALLGLLEGLGGSEE